jgi:AAA+ ATPase superfamily predicted ATPase
MTEDNSIDDEIIKKVNDDVAMYLSTKDLIEQEFDRLFLQSIRGEDISSEIPNLYRKIPNQMRTIGNLFDRSDDQFTDLLKKVGQPEDVIQELMDFKIRYFEVLNPELDRFFSSTVQNRINSWIYISNMNSMDMDRNMPMIDLRMYSYGREILRIRDDVDDILDLAVSLVDTVIESMEVCTESGASIDDSIVENLQEYSSKINGQLNELNNLIEKIPKKESDDF